MKETLKNSLGCLVWIAVFLSIPAGYVWYDSYQKQRKTEQMLEKKQKDSIRTAFIKDSLIHDPHYIDSIRKAEKEYLEWKRQEDSLCCLQIVGFILDGDTIYHTSFHDFKHVKGHFFGVLTSDLSKVKLLTENDIDIHSYKQCTECSDVEYVYGMYNNGELFSEEDAKDHDLIPMDEACDYCGSISYDDDDDRW